MDKRSIDFTSKITSKLEKFYGLDESASTKKYSLGDEIEGFLEAGILLGVITKEEFLTIADDIHYSIHGKSLNQRIIETRTGLKSDERVWDKYNEPSYIRKKKEQ